MSASFFLLFGFGYFFRFQLCNYFIQKTFFSMAAIFLLLLLAFLTLTLGIEASYETLGTGTVGQFKSE
jgi:hypothetical protein